MVGIFKDKMKKILDNNANMIQAPCKFVLDYRSTTHGTTGKSPAELHLNKKLNNKFDLVLTQLENKTENNDNAGVKTRVDLSESKQKETYRKNEIQILK